MTLQCFAPGKTHQPGTVALFWIPLIAEPVKLHLRDVRKPATESVAIDIRTQLGRVRNSVPV